MPQELRSEASFVTYHGLAWNKLDDAGITRFDKLGRGFNRFTRSTIDLLDEFSEFAGNVGSVAIKDGSITSTNLSGVVKDDNLGVERTSLLSGVVLRVGGNVSTTDILDGDVPIKR